MKSLLVLAICFAVSVEVAPALSRGKRDETLDVSQGQFTADELRQLKALLEKMAVKKSTTNSLISGPTTSPDRDEQILKITPTVTATGKSEGDEALESENHSHSTELQKEKSPTSKSAIADIRDQLSKLSDNLNKLKELVLKSRENTPGGSQRAITKTKEDNTKLTTPETPEDEITTPKVTEKTKGTTTYKPPTNISQKAEPTTTKFTNATKKTTTAEPTTNLKAAKANATIVKETANVTVTTKNTTPDVTTTPKDPIKKTTTAKSTMNSVTRTTKERTSDKLPTTKAVNATKPPTKVTLITEKKTTDKRPTPRKPTKKINKQINNGANETSTVNVKTKELGDGGATPSNTTRTAATKLDPRTWVKNSNFPVVLMVAISLTIFLAMGYYNRRKIQNTIKKTCNVKQKTDRGYVKVKLEDEVELPRDANREYIY